MTNTLQRKLSKLQQEKVDIENALEQEQEAIVNRLQKQLDALRCQQSPIPSPSLSVRSGSFVQDAIGPSPCQPTSPGLPSPIVGSPSMKWRAGHSASGSDHASAQMVSEVLKAEINAGRIRQADLEKEGKSFLLQREAQKVEARSSPSYPSAPFTYSFTLMRPFFLFSFCPSLSLSLVTSHCPA